MTEIPPLNLPPSDDMERVLPALPPTARRDAEGAGGHVLPPLQGERGCLQEHSPRHLAPVLAPVAPQHHPLASRHSGRLRLLARPRRAGGPVLLVAQSLSLLAPPKVGVCSPVLLYLDRTRGCLPDRQQPHLPGSAESIWDQDFPVDVVGDGATMWSLVV